MGRRVDLILKKDSPSGFSKQPCCFSKVQMIFCGVGRGLLRSSALAWDEVSVWLGFVDRRECLYRGDCWTRLGLSCPLCPGSATPDPH